MAKLTIALAKGRTKRAALTLFGQAQIEFNSSTTEQISMHSKCDNYQIVTIRSHDVPAYVARGAADLGIVGLDVICESKVTELLRLLDLQIATCRLAIATAKHKPLAQIIKQKQITCATSFINLASTWLTENQINAEIIKLAGSVEIAVEAKLADFIIDLVDSGQTLAAHNLIEEKTILHSSAFLISNKVAYAREREKIKALRTKLQQIIT